MVGAKKSFIEAKCCDLFFCDEMLKKNLVGSERSDIQEEKIEAVW